MASLFIYLLSNSLINTLYFVSISSKFSGFVFIVSMFDDVDSCFPASFTYSFRSVVPGIDFIVWVCVNLLYSSFLFEYSHGNSTSIVTFSLLYFSQSYPLSTVSPVFESYSIE